MIIELKLTSCFPVAWFFPHHRLYNFLLNSPVYLLFGIPFAIKQHPIR